jgi:hypothetical protein
MTSNMFNIDLAKRAKRSLVALTRSGDLLIHARDLLIAAMGPDRKGSPLPTSPCGWRAAGGCETLNSVRGADRGGL